MPQLWSTNSYLPLLEALLGATRLAYFQYVNVNPFTIDERAPFIEEIHLPPEAKHLVDLSSQRLFPSSARLTRHWTSLLSGQGYRQ